MKHYGWECASRLVVQPQVNVSSPDDRHRVAEECQPSSILMARCSSGIPGLPVSIGVVIRASISGPYIARLKTAMVSTWLASENPDRINAENPSIFGRISSCFEEITRAGSQHARVIPYSATR